MHKTRPLFKTLCKSNASSAKSRGGRWEGGGERQRGGDSGRNEEISLTSS